jgi:undecaprenyl-diphosphatase
MIPVGHSRCFFMSEVESVYNGNIIFVGSMLLVTASLLLLTYLAKSTDKDVTFRDAFIIGLAQALQYCRAFHVQGQPLQRDCSLE